jgi:hypothetical protein
MIDAKFSDGQWFEPNYKRNNKGKSRKNLRCFPKCRLAGHVAAGYCGRPVLVDVSYDYEAAKGLDLVAFCQVRCIDDVQGGGVFIGKRFHQNEVLEQSRGHGHRPGDRVLHPWFPGFLIKSSRQANSSTINAEFSFNYRNQGWHYPWKAQSRQGSNHELHVFVLAGSQHLPFATCVCEISSPSFNVQCRRKEPADQASSSSAAAAAAAPGVKRAAAGLKRAAAEISSPNEFQLAKHSASSVAAIAAWSADTTLPASSPCTPLMGSGLPAQETRILTQQNCSIQPQPSPTKHFVKNHVLPSIRQISVGLLGSVGEPVDPRVNQVLLKNLQHLQAQRELLESQILQAQVRIAESCQSLTQASSMSAVTVATAAAAARTQDQSDPLSLLAASAASAPTSLWQR